MDLRARSLQLAKSLKQNYAELTAVLIAMQRQNLFVKGVYSYCFDELGLSEYQSSYFKRVVLASIEVPQLEKAVTSGDISVSQARRIVSVVTLENAEVWIEKAKELPQRQLEKAVSEVNPDAFPTTVNIAVTLEVAELLRKIQDLESQRTKRAASANDSMKKAFTEFIERHDPVKKAERARPPKKELPQEATRALPRPIKHAVVRRDENRCTHVYDNGVRCNSQRWLEIHHKTPLAQGGLTIADNLTTLCAAHHRHQHDTVQKGPPGQTQMRW